MPFIQRLDGLVAIIAACDVEKVEGERISSWHYGHCSELLNLRHVAHFGERFKYANAVVKVLISAPLILLLALEGLD